MTRLVIDNYRWVPAQERKGNRWYYKRDSYYQYDNLGKTAVTEQIIATVNYDSNPKSPHWGKWHVSFGAQSPALNRLRLQESPKFSSKKDAIAWATTVIALEGLS